MESKVHSRVRKTISDVERLNELGQRLIFEYKNSIILDLRKDLQIRMKLAQEQDNIQLINELMDEMKNLDHTKETTFEEFRRKSDREVFIITGKISMTYNELVSNPEFEQIASIEHSEMKSFVLGEVAKRPLWAHIANIVQITGLLVFVFGVF